MYEDPLTTEALRKKFKNNFNLCNFAIRIGRAMILDGSQSKLADVLVAVDLRADLEETKNRS